MNKIRSFFPNGNSKLASNRNSSLEPELGFQLVLELSSSSEDSTHQQQFQQKTQPQLNVNLIAARHLPTHFGFKSVQGYVVKVKMFPGSTKYDSCIQTNSWPKFDENFKFSLEPDRKSSIKMSPAKMVQVDTSDNQIDKLFSGQFVVLTVYALLELPPGNFNRINKTYRSLRDRSASIVQRISEQGSNNNSDKNSKSKDSGTKKNSATSKKEEEKEVPEMTKTESRRNIGSVTCYLEPKIFKRSSKINSQYLTEELWYPIKDLTVSPLKPGNTALHIPSTSHKGQLELALELCYLDNDEASASDIAPVKSNSSKTQSGSATTTTTTSSPNSLTKKPSFVSDMKKKLSVRKSKGTKKGFALKVTTTKFRCSIKVKDELESIGSQIYVKTAIYDGDIPINSWKSNHFTPSLSSRWDPKNSTIEVPLPNLECLNQMRIKTTLATKSKVGKKLIFGTIIISSNVTQDYYEHWKNTINSRNEPIVMWHNFQ